MNPWLQTGIGMILFGGFVACLTMVAIHASEKSWASARWALLAVVCLQGARSAADGCELDRLEERVEKLEAVNVEED